MRNQAQKSKALPALEACKSDRAVSVRELIGRLGEKWSLLIVIALSRQPGNRARFSELKNGIEGVSQTMLTSTLRTLERDGLITREVFPEIPPRVEYQLTRLGLDVLEPMSVLAEWAAKNWPRVRRSRVQYDDRKKG